MTSGTSAFPAVARSKRPGKNRRLLGQPPAPTPGSHSASGIRDAAQATTERRAPTPRAVRGIFRSVDDDRLTLPDSASTSSTWVTFAPWRVERGRRITFPFQ